jgi:hypothetical protein
VRKKENIKEKTAREMNRKRSADSPLPHPGRDLYKRLKVSENKSPSASSSSSSSSYSSLAVPEYKENHQQLQESEKKHRRYPKNQGWIFMHKKIEEQKEREKRNHARMMKYWEKYKKKHADLFQGKKRPLVTPERVWSRKLYREQERADREERRTNRLREVKLRKEEQKRKRREGEIFDPNALTVESDPSSSPESDLSTPLSSPPSEHSPLPRRPEPMVLLPPRNVFDDALNYIKRWF